MADDNKSKRSRYWIIGGGVAVAVILLVAEHQSVPGASLLPSVPPSSLCTMKVTGGLDLNVRNGPSTNNAVVGTLSPGAVVGADTVTSNGFRQLGPSRWAMEQYLAPEPGAVCS
ncbi:MAG TPA: hypothetical protein VIY28_14440 [Pseudonocardiaceae bacterium]